MLITFVLAFVVIGPLVVFVTMLFRRRYDKRRSDGLYWGVAATAFAFMILHYLLYLRGYAITEWFTLFRDIFYTPQYF